MPTDDVTSLLTGLVIRCPTCHVPVELIGVKDEFRPGEMKYTVACKTHGRLTKRWHVSMDGARAAPIIATGKEKHAATEVP